jgi:CarD family transcriptional regulator
MFLVNDRVVYPGYGVALISKLVKRLVSGKTTSFYELKFFNKDMAVLVPEDRLEAVGIRKLSSEQDLEEMFKLLAQPVEKVSYEVGFNNWNKRNKKYQINLRSGDLLKICQIYRDLAWISQTKELSFGERTLKLKIEQLLIEEISVVRNIDKEKALKVLHKSFIGAKQIKQASLKKEYDDEQEIWREKQEILKDAKKIKSSKQIEAVV